MDSAGAISFRIDTQRGGRITSIRNAGTEWLSAVAGPSGSSPGEPAVELSAWDEVAPSIAPASTAAGGRVASHGDLVRSAWAQGDDGWLHAALPSLRGAFARRASVVNGRLRLDYRVTAEYPESMLWAAHPIIDWEPGTEILVAGCEDAGWIRHDDGDRPVGADTLARAVRALDPAASGKYFVPVDARPTEVLVCRAGGRAIRLRWDPELVPYLGLWLDAGAWGGAPVLAVEPTTGWGDSLDGAREARRVLSVPPTGSHSWWIEIDFPEEGQFLYESGK